MRKLTALLLALVLSAPGLYAQRIIGCGGGDPPPDPPPPPPPPPPVTCPGSTAQTPVNTSWGYYQWQVDQPGGNTTTLMSETGFNTPPGLVQIPVTLACAATVHEVHGNFAFGVFQGGTCGTGAIIAQVWDQNGNAIVSLDVAQFGQSNTDISVKGTFPTPLSVTSLTIRFYVPNCGSQVASWSLTMS